MGTVSRTRLLMAAFCLSLCGLGLTAGTRTLAQVAPTMDIVDDCDARFTLGSFDKPTIRPSGMYAMCALP